MNYWEKTEAKLLEMEANEQADLFVIGYLIPHVGLAEINCPEDVSPESHFKSLVRQSIEKDKATFNGDDMTEIIAVLDQL